MIEKYPTIIEIVLTMVISASFLSFFGSLDNQNMSSNLEFGRMFIFVVWLPK